jgi:hypothetical protein
VNGEYSEVSQMWVYRPKYGQALTVHRAGAGGLGTGADRHKDGECTWVECDLAVNEPHSVTALVVSDVLRGVGWMWGLTEEVRKVRIALAFLPLISIMDSI